MKKNRVLFGIFIVLLIASAYFIFSRSSNTIKSELSDFAVKDTASITKIFLADRKNHQLSLEKTNGSWLVNGKYKARPDAISTLLKTIYQIEVRSPIGERAQNTIIRHLSSVAIKCEIYLDNKKKPEIIYYVGGGTQDMLGTFMYIENSTVPFSVHIPGFDGYLTPRYRPLIDSWVFPSVFNIKAPDIQKVEINYFDNSTKSFRITKQNELDYALINKESGTAENNISQNLIQAYLDQFQFINYEARASLMSKAKRDSLSQVGPFANLTLTDVNNNITSVTMYRMEITERSKNIMEEDNEYDVDRFYGSINNDTTWVVMQYYVFNKLLLDSRNFKTGL